MGSKGDHTYCEFDDFELDDLKIFMPFLPSILFPIEQKFIPLLAITLSKRMIDAQAGLQMLPSLR